MGRAYWKTVFSTVKDNVGRFLAITAIIALGVAFVAGLGTLSEKMENTISANMVEQRVADLVVKGTTEAGLSKDEIAAVAALDGVESTLAFTMLDVETESGSGQYVRVYLLPTLDDLPLNTLKMQAGGRLPVAGDEPFTVEGWAERPGVVMPSYAVGDEVKITMYGILEITVKLVGIVGNPLVTFRGGEPNQIEAAEAETADDLSGVSSLVGIFYLDQNIIKQQFGLSELPLPITDMWVKGEATQAGGDLFDRTYTARADALKTAVEGVLNAETTRVLTLQENTSYQVVRSYSDKIKVVTMIFPVFFIAVAALVVLTNVTRMTEEERGMIGCYKSLGFGDGAVIFKYLGFCALCCLLGCGVGMLLGLTAVPAAIFPAFPSILFIEGEAPGVNPAAGLIALGCTTAIILAVTVWLVANQLKGMPAALLQPKAPKPGKVIWLEHIPFLWNPLPFRFKSTFRNLFRHKRHLIMTVVSVAGSTALVLAGFGLMDVWSNPDAYAFGAGMEEAFTAISVVIILFAVALCVLVIYNLTNMNIGERRREIATLKVLGYRDGEVAGYIYREIFIMALMGIPVGLVAGFCLLLFAFSYLNFGSVYDVSWSSYLCSAAIVVATVAIVDALLYRKLQHVDMTASLKTVE